jgi:hypothetical protein
MTQTSAEDQASASSARRNENQPSLLQHHLGQLHHLVDSQIADPRHKAMSHTKLEELEAWLTWAGVKGTAVQVENLKPADEPAAMVVLTTDNFIKTLDRSKDYVLELADAEGRYTLKVQTPGSNEWVMYLSPSPSEMTPDEANSLRIFMETEFGL